MKDRPKHLIKKFLRDELSVEEAGVLKTWMETPGGKEFLKKEIQLQHLLHASLYHFDEEQAYARTSHTIRRSEKRTATRWGYIRYAAILVVLLGCGYFLYTYMSSNTRELVIPDEQITLELEDGTVQTIVSGERQHIITGTNKTITVQKGDTLHYASVLPQDQLLYNTLRVPYGKTFKLKLSDGTIAHLNAGTRLRFPVKFGEGTRKVFLEGEAFFKVKSDPDNPFLVRTEKMDVTVTGTRFNVSAYQDDPKTKVVLTRGKVGVRGTEETEVTTVLSPGQMGVIDKRTSQITTEKVDVEDYTAWMEGKVIFDNKAFSDVLKILERKYNVTIKNNYTGLNEERFKATFDNETIEQVLHTFTESRLFSYHVRDNVIVIEKPGE